MSLFKTLAMSVVLGAVGCSAPTMSVRSDASTPSGVRVEYEDSVVVVTTYPVTLPRDPTTIAVTGFSQATKVTVTCKMGGDIYTHRSFRAEGRNTLVFACGGYNTVAVTNKSVLSYEFIRSQPEHANPHEVIFYDRLGVLVTSCRTHSEQCAWFLNDSGY